MRGQVFLEDSVHHNDHSIQKNLNKRIKQGSRPLKSSAYTEEMKAAMYRPSGKVKTPCKDHLIWQHAKRRKEVR